MKYKKKMSSSTKLKVLGVRSGLEEKFKELLETKGVAFEYEPKDKRISYTIPASQHNYSPDFVLADGTVIETKGMFKLDDRKKHLLIKEQHPEKVIKFVFSNPNTKLDKRSKTTYATWCEKHNFEYCSIKDLEIIETWLK